MALSPSLGVPARYRVQQEVSAEELAMVRASLARDRDPVDVTVFAFAPDGSVAAIRKPSYPPGAYRAPSGGPRRAEDLVDAAVREAWEELGVAVVPHRHVLCADVEFACGPQRLAWRTHVLTARAPATPLAPRDRREVAEARWLRLEELQGPVRRLLVATGRGLLRYRVALTDAVVTLLRRHPELLP